MMHTAPKLISRKPYKKPLRCLLSKVLMKRPPEVLLVKDFEAQNWWVRFAKNILEESLMTQRLEKFVNKALNDCP